MLAAEGGISEAVWASFNTDYHAAREGFLHAARAAGAQLDAHRCPKAGPGGEPLFMDAAYLGPPEPRRLLVVTSGMHGCEGFAGSAVQIDALRRGVSIDGAGVLFVHALNPFGMAWLTVENEDLIDPNRNFIDYDQPAPQNELYDEVHAFAAPATLFGPAREASDGAYRRYIDQYGLARYTQAALNGQRHRPGAYSFAGQQPIWTNTTIRRVLAGKLAGATRSLLIDIHTGYGPRGAGLLLWDNRNAKPGAAERAEHFFGTLVRLHTPEFMYSPSGAFIAAFPEMAAHAETLAFALEYGTEPPDRMLQVLRDCYWLQTSANAEDRRLYGPAIQAEMAACFSPTDFAWRSAILSRGREVLMHGRDWLTGA
jgi:hypothetical protein